MIYFINNAIVVSVHILIVIVSAVVRKYFIYPETLFITSNTVPFTLILVASVVMYIACGYFLKSTEKYMFLSVLSIPIVLIVIFIFYTGKGGEAGFNYFYFNPIIVPLLDTLAISDIVNAIIIFTSPFIPSVLIYIGISLKKGIISS